MKELIIIYDDSIEVPERIKTIIGKNHYGEIVLKRKSLFEHFVDILNENDLSYKIINMKDVNDIKNDESLILENRVIFHYFANNPINNKDEFGLILKKLIYSKKSYTISSETIIGIVFNEEGKYLDFIKNYKFNKNINDYVNFEKIETKSCVDISNYQNLLYYITGGFDARYFNSISGDEYTVIKSSNDKTKMKMEHSYYYLLPDYMKKWIVMPYDYKDEKNKASYKMERMPMTDIAIRWTHGAIDIEEMNQILEKTFHFINTRPTKKVSKDEYKKISNKLYLEKLNDRIETLKKKPEFNKIAALIKAGTNYNTIDEIVEKYNKLYNENNRYDNQYELSMGHGDLFFANMLYSKELNMLKLIDPKGGLTEEDLWMNPYYDIAKLSHSICGRYDFFNVDRYRLYLNKEMNFEIEYMFDNEKFVKLFKKFLESNHYNYKLVRLYEASLFLSMLPLHIDNVHKVFGFLLNAINIMKEVENV